MEEPKQPRIVVFQSRNPLVGILILAVVLAFLAFFLTAGLALAAGASVIGGGVFAARRLFGKRVALKGTLDDALEVRRLRMEGTEVFAPTAIESERRLTNGDDSPA